MGDEKVMNIENAMRVYLDIQIEKYLRTVPKKPEMEETLYKEVAIVKSCLEYCFIEMTMGQLDAIAKVNKIHFNMK